MFPSSIVSEKVTEKATPKAITNCPACGSNVEFIFENEKFCTRCDWNSIAASVASGKLDSMFAKRESLDDLALELG